MNLGLLPSSEESWPTACQALQKLTGGYLHIHGNVDIDVGDEPKKDQLIDSTTHASQKSNDEKSDKTLITTTDTTTNNNTRREWMEWAERARKRVKEILESDKNENIVSKEAKCNAWKVEVKHIEYVKSYGPRVDHLVLDLECRPSK